MSEVNDSVNSIGRDEKLAITVNDVKSESSSPMLRSSVHNPSQHLRPRFQSHQRGQGFRGTGGGRTGRGRGDFMNRNRQFHFNSWGSNRDFQGRGFPPSYYPRTYVDVPSDFPMPSFPPPPPPPFIFPHPNVPSQFPGYAPPFNYYSDIYYPDWFVPSFPDLMPPYASSSGNSSPIDIFQTDTEISNRVPDAELCKSIIHQIDYYFSEENLIRDMFLRQHMDREGWVSVNLISSFRRIHYLTKDINVILYAMQASEVVEVQGYKMRRRENWENWLLPQNSDSQNNNPELLVDGIQNLHLGINTNCSPEIQKSSEESNADEVSDKACDKGTG